MEGSISRKEFSMKEAGAYIILGYEKCKKNKENIRLMDILKSIIDVTGEVENRVALSNINKELLNKINFSWEITINDLTAYAACVFEVLSNREKEITNEKIIKEFLEEIYAHHPRRTLKEADVIICTATKKSRE